MISGWWRICESSERHVLAPGVNVSTQDDHLRLPWETLTMEFLSGETLASHLASRGRLECELSSRSWSSSRRVGTRPTSRGSWIGDLKTANIMLTSSGPVGRVVITDLGLAAASCARNDLDGERVFALPPTSRPSIPRGTRRPGRRRKDATLGDAEIAAACHLAAWRVLEQRGPFALGVECGLGILRLPPRGLPGPANAAHWADVDFPVRRTPRAVVTGSGPSPRPSSSRR